MITSDLEEVLPKEQIRNNDEQDHLLGNSGIQVIEATTEEDISKVLTFANKYNKTVNVVSGGTKRGYGGVADSADILLSLAKYSGIVEHSVGDLTLTVKPGTTLKEISDELSKHDQFVALDTPWPELATIGGVIAGNDSGPKRLLYGSARDLVIGTRIVYPDGEIIRTGGKVVKNVAGYDMNKMFVGSMGTLGVISEITMKLRPLPKFESLMLLQFPEGLEKEIKDFAVRVLDSKMEPVALEVINPGISNRIMGQDSYTLALTFEDRKAAVLYQEEWVHEHAPEGTTIQTLHEEEARQWWDQFRALGPNGYNDEEDEANTQAALKIGSNNMDVLTNLKIANKLALESSIDIEAHGGFGHGISRVYLKGDAADLIPYVQALRTNIEEKSGYVVCTHLPFTLRKTLNVWGEKPGYFAILEGLKDTNDPLRILNRQRFVGGL